MKEQQGAEAFAASPEKEAEPSGESKTTDALPLTAERNLEAASPPEPLRSRRAPWWMYVVAASYAALVALFLYVVFWGPAELLGVTAEYDDRGMLVTAVGPSSVPGRAGLRAGDRVLSIDGRPIRRRRDWYFSPDLEVGRAQSWTIVRDGERAVLEVVPERTSWRDVVVSTYATLVTLSLCTFLISVFVAFRRPWDPVARTGAWLLATNSVAWGLPSGWAALWRELPLVVQAFLWIPEVGRFVVDGIFLSFFLVFPRRLSAARWPWVLVWAPVLAPLPWRVAQFSDLIYRTHEASSVPAWVGPFTGVRTLLYLVTGVVVLAVNYRRLDAQDKRRARVLVAGTAIGVFPAIESVWFFTFSGASSFSVLQLALIHPLALATPVCFAYAILRHRVFGIRVMVRQGLQYGLARGAVIGLLPLMVALLLVDLALNSHESLASILSDRGWAYSGLGGVSLAAYWRRRPWLDALDRRFFREAYDADRILLGLVDRVKECSSLQEISEQVSTEIGAALHPECVHVVFRQPDRTEFSIGSSADGVRLPLIREDSAFARVLAKRPAPVDLSAVGAEGALPGAERAWLEKLRIDLVVPVPGPGVSLAGLILLGHKRSEELYSPTDRSLLQAIAGQVAVVCQNLWLQDRVDRESRVRRDVLAHLDEHHVNLVKECPACGLCFDRSEEVCSEDGAELALSLPVERLLDERYRLDRVLGRGGMGAVFEAEDTRLGRPVAVKLMTGHLFGNTDALRRFEREAQASARLSHPNIIAVHDYGRTGGGAFLVMELIRGTTLRGWLVELGRLPWSTAADWFGQTLDGLAAAHARGIVHRDLKPENLMIAGASHEGGTVKILDFGLAKARSESAASTGLTAPGTVLGTYAYMSPEQLAGAELDERSDLFSLGVVVAEALAGSHPFPARTAAERLHAIRRGPVPLEGDAAAVQSLQAVLARALAYERDDRYESAQELRAALIGALEPGSTR